MLDINSFKCTFMLIVLFTVSAVGLEVVKSGGAVLHSWQMGGFVYDLIGFLFRVVATNVIIAFIAGAIAWLCGRKKIPFPTLCNVAISSIFIFQFVSGLVRAL